MTNKVISNRWIISAVGLIILLLSILTVLSKPVSAEATVPFECSGDFYIGYGEDATAPTEFNSIDGTADPFTYSSIATLSTTVNALGSRVQDGYIYGFKRSDPNKNSLYKIDSNGDETIVGVPTGYPAAPAASSEGTFAGDFANDGLLYTVQTTDSGTTNAYVKTNVVAGTAVEISADIGVRTDDIAYNPRTDLFYGYDTIADRFFSLTTAGSVTLIGPSYSFAGNGAAWFDSLGNFYAYENTTGIIRQVNLDAGEGQVGSIVRSITAPVVGQNDGTSCPYSPNIFKTASPRTVQQGAVVTYTYILVNNHFSDAVSANFSDTMPDARKYIAGTLASDAGGTVGSYGGTSTLTITGLSIPANTSRTITVNVQIPTDFPIGTVQNQATLSNVTGDFNPSSTYVSDDSTTILREDPTEIAVIAADVVPGPPNAGKTLSRINPAVLLGTVIGLGLLPIIGKRLSKKNRS